ncbi:cytidylate kinase family protein [Candidatus Woesearchaeota archaeon]|nr:cytidylate kinase family protein [Candidatus Woesearchaeota archaeon]
MILTISGTPGSGKSTIAKILAGKLNAERIYVGGIRRELAKKKGMTLVELNEYAKTHPETDVDVDKKAAQEARKMAQQKKDVIVEGRTQFHFLPESVKVYVKVDHEEGARRIWKDLQQADTRQQRNEGEFSSFEEFKKKLQEREKLDAKRYLKYYGLDHHNEKQYDLVVDTTKITAQEGAKRILEWVKRLQKK